MSAAMKPILFSTPMVQAILDGRKTMTRRVMKDCTQFDIEESQLLENTGYNLTHNYKMSIESVGIFSTKEKLLNWFVSKYSKYQVGDVLWVRETWCLGVLDGDATSYKEYWCIRQPKDSKRVFYKADCIEETGYCDSDKLVKWKPSIFMPKKHARIFLRVTNVRVERLQDISEDDAQKEGVEPLFDFTDVCPETGNPCSDFKTPFQDLWNSINGKGAWEANPYVFVYTFQRIEKPC